MSDSKLSIIYKKPAELVPYKNNARLHNEKQINEIEASIKEFGFTAPILIGDKKNILAGHGRLMAAINLGMETVPTIELSKLSAVQQRAYILADNKLSLNATWDVELLGIEITALKELEFNIDLTGFSKSMVSNITNRLDFDDDDYKITFRVVVKCKDEQEQNEAFTLLENSGYNCQVQSI